MGKSSKNKKSKVPKITEEEYSEYLTALKSAEESSVKRVEGPPAAATAEQPTEQ